MTEQEAVELIQKAGSEWQRTRGDMKSYLRTVIRLAEEAEREACAKLCDKAYASALPAELANAIRARGNDEH